MKLLIISEGYYPYTGGLEKIVTEVAEGLNRKENYEVTVLTSTREKTTVHTDNVNGIDVYYIPLSTSHGKIKFIKELINARNVLKRLLRDSYDFISIQYMGYLSAIFSTIKTGIPYSISIHGTDVTRKHGFIVNLLQKKIVNNSRALISNSYYLAQELQKKLTISIQDRLYVIWNGIALENYKTVEKLPTKHIVVSVGRFVHKKGFDVLIEAFNKVIEKYSDALLIIAGDGGERPKCEALVEKYELKNNVQFLGLVPNNEIGKVFEKGRIFVCPSRNEPFGIVVLEAMAIGVPVVATNSGGVSEIIEDNKYGYIVPIEDPKAMAEKIEELFDDYNKCLDLREKGLERVNEFTLEKVVEKYDEAFLNCLS